MPRDALVLSPYDAASHIRWRRGLARHLTEYRWEALPLPARCHSWRARGNSLSYAFAHRDTLTAPRDLLLATSVTDLCALRGFVPELARLPTLVYLHENQFAYPSRDGTNTLHLQLQDIYTALCADVLASNSTYNLHTLLRGARALLHRLPDAVPPGLPERIEARARVLPVPLDDSMFTKDPLATRELDAPVSLVWNHRWEHDKAPERFVDAMLALDALGHDFTLHVVGQRFRTAPPCFEELRARLPHRLSTFGFVEDVDDYHRILASSDLILSTALHDFQGLAVLEACAMGCVPVLPDRVAYPEYTRPEHRYSSSEAHDPDVRALVAHLDALLTSPSWRARSDARADVSRFRWSRLRDAYLDTLETTLTAHREAQAP
ncbi:MAG: DUF3524 domain-containing protein [Myxococcota bacterium]